MRKLLRMSYDRLRDNFDERLVEQRKMTENDIAEFHRELVALLNVLYGHRHLYYFEQTPLERCSPRFTVVMTQGLAWAGGVWESGKAHTYDQLAEATVQLGTLIKSPSFAESILEHDQVRPGVLAVDIYQDLIRRLNDARGQAWGALAHRTIEQDMLGFLRSLLEYSESYLIETTEGVPNQLWLGNNGAFFQGTYIDEQLAPTDQDVGTAFLKYLLADKYLSHALATRLEVSTLPHPSLPRKESADA